MEPEDFDSFEFIDYTTSGPWEKFIVQIEDCLKHWGLVHNSYGVFNPNVMPTTDGTGLNLDDELALALNEDRPNSDTAAHKDPITASTTTTTATTTAGAAAQASQPAPATSTAEPTAGSYEHNATVTLENTSYVLSYRYHPAKARIAAGVERIDLDFLPISLEGLDHHILHRWTALTHILVLAPAANTDSHIIDLGSAKLLLSSFAIAFQNTGCNIPVFVPTGHPKNKTYTGLSIQPQLSHARDSELGLEETAEDQAIEVRLNTVVVPYPPAQYTNLSGILDLFIERMGLEDEFTDGGVIGAVAYSQEVKEQIHVSGLFSYQLDNWYDDKWRQWADTGAGVPQESTATDPLLPIGPIHDPLKSLQLVARFASAPSTVYLDSKNLTDMDASQANIWIIKALFKSEDYGLLSGILGDVISSWISGLSIASSVGSRGSEKEQRSYTSLLRKGARLIQGTISMVDAADVDNIAKTLLKTPASSTSQYTSAQLESTQPHIESCLKVHQVVSAAELGLRFRHASIVPQGSLLWKMLIHLVDVISPNSHISYPTSFMGFLKALWAVLLKQITALWEERKMIPWIPVFLEPDVEEQANEISISNQQHNDKDQHTRTPVVDLRFNLLHQKLSMVNCCIVRDHNEREERAAMLRKSPVNDNSLFSTPSSSATFSESTVQAPAMLVQDSELGASTANALKDIGTIAPEETEGRSQSGQHVNDDEDAEGLNYAVKGLTKEDVPVLSKDATSSKPESTSFKGLTLLETGASLVVPRLQEPGCMTEDMIREQEELLENLGSTPDAAKTRAEMQSAQLISDMSAFKAANLGCVLGDFIRWHSPKDWDNERRQMSSRMADSGNFWQELWE
ncbi:Rab3 GTPase-activating protein catalytic subunit, partial [Dissophora globulifera]